MADMGELLLELLSEEIPARMQRRAIEDLTALIRGKLALAQIPADGLHGYVTPRRLTVIGDGIPERQPQRRKERRGPRVGASRAALDGFLRASGLDSIEQCEIRDTGRGEFYFAVLQHPGRAAAEVVPELLRAAINELPWPKSMRFPAASFRWVRPLVSVICLFDGAVLPLPLDGVPVGRNTRGHRFLSEGEIAVDNAADYLDRLEAAHVILNHNRRRGLIEADLHQLAAAKGLEVKPDPGLLDEVTGLVEFPVVLMGAIEADFMTLQPEVLQTVMRTHQRYFSCGFPDGTPAPWFLFVANNRAADGGKAIIDGNERVFRARLADARFFWGQDLKVRLEDRVEALKQRIFHDKLGTVYDKSERIAALAKSLAGLVRFTSESTRRVDPGRAERAAWLAKADLSTAMVGEFPELQGIIGGYYYEIQHRFENVDVQKQLQNVAIALAIRDHYKPLGRTDSCPKAPESIVVALSDKIDSLVAFFAISVPPRDDDYRPTGSRDPYALRRASLGIIRIIVENRIRVNLKDAFTRAAEIFYQERRAQNWEDRIRPLYVELITFIVDRLKVHLRDRGVRHDLIAAAFAQVGEAESDLVRLLKRVDALQDFLASEDGANLLIAYRRAANIVAIEERRDGQSYDRRPDFELLQQEEEKALDRAFREVLTAPDFAGEDFSAAMTRLATLRRPVDEFFEKVTVNTVERRLRENRLQLLSWIRATMNRVADFSQIEG